MINRINACQLECTRRSTYRPMACNFKLSLNHPRSSSGDVNHERHSLVPPEGAAKLLCLLGMAADKDPLLLADGHDR